MDRVNHIKIVTPDPAAVRAFLTEILDVPDGWKLGDYPAPPAEIVGPARDPNGAFTLDGLFTWNGLAGGSPGGMIVGSGESRQFQVFHAEQPKIWGVAIGTRHLEQAHERCTERGVPCSEIRGAPWGQEDGGIRFFFAEVGGVVFEVMRIEDAPPD
jgi:catechol 2,3-dioxygenase-like lactoylglutathione lyase family enzyme